MKRINAFRLTAFTLVIHILAVGCTKKENEHNVLSAEEKAQGWTLLFDGKTLDNWHVYNKGKQASEWSAFEGEILCNPDSPDRTGDLVTDKEYENYELQFDWKLSDKGNSGVFINVVEADSLTAAWLSGPEYQLLDNNHKDYAVPTKRSGCLYSFTNQKNEVKMSGAQWNHSKVIQENGKVKFYLNDVLTSEMDFLSPEWRELVSNSGFARYQLFGKSTKGKIGLQDWASGVSFRNIKIREL